MDGIPPALPTDSEDVVWALQTADSLWKRGQRADAVVWVRRAAQAAGDSDDAKRAAALARKAVELSDVIKGKKTPAKKKPFGMREQSLEELDRMFGDPTIAKAAAKPKPAPPPKPVSPAEVISADDFEKGFKAPTAPPVHPPSEAEVMTISSHAPDLELIEEEAAESIEAESIDDEYPEDEATPVRGAAVSPVPSAAQAHAGMLDPWAERESTMGKDPARAAKRTFDEEEVITSAKRPAQRPPTSASDDDAQQVPPAPKAPRIGAPRKPAPATRVDDDEPDTTTYRQINPRTPRGDRARPSAPAAAKPPKPPPVKPTPPPKAPSDRPGSDLLELVDNVIAEPLEEAPPTPQPPARAAAPRTPPPRTPPPRTPPPPTPAPRTPAPATPIPEVDPDDIVLEAVPDVEPGTPTAPPASSAPPSAPTPSARPSGLPTPRPAMPSQLPVSARPTAPPPSTMPLEAIPSAPPTRPRAGSTLLDLTSVEALSDLPDDARESFGQAAKLHSIALEEEVANFALALVVDGTIDVSSSIVDAPALKLEKNAILRSRGTLVPGVSLRLVGSSPKATVATWDDAAVAEAFRSCPWVEDDLRAVADKVQAKVGLTMGPLGERWDLSLREHLLSKLAIKSLAPGEQLVVQGKPAPLAIVGVGELIVTGKDGAKTGTLRPGDFVFPQQTLAHGNAPGSAAAGPGGAIVLYGDRAVAQELLMSFPPILEVLATI